MYIFMFYTINLYNVICQLCLNLKSDIHLVGLLRALSYLMFVELLAQSQEYFKCLINVSCYLRNKG